MINKKNTILLIDGNALLHRAWHALPLLTNPQGKVVNALYGFIMIFLKALGEIKPKYVAVAFDRPEETFRAKEYKEYKAHREKQVDELYEQIPMIQEFLHILGVPILEAPGFEADDILATLVNCSEFKDLSKIILTGDLDLLQLVDKDIEVYMLKKGISDVVVYNLQAVQERYGLLPEQLLDFKALVGDSSDNIPGVSGIGQKTAKMLLQKYKNLEKLYNAVENEENIKPNVRQKLIAGKKDAFFSKSLIKIVDNVDLDIKKEDFLFNPSNKDLLVNFLRKHNFKSLLTKINDLNWKEKKLAKIGNEKIKNYIHILDQKRLEDLVFKLQRTKIFAFDTETTSLNIFEAKIIGMSFAFDDGLVYYLDFLNFISLKDKKFSEIREILEDENIKKIGHNIKYDIKVLKRNNINLNGIFADTMLAAYLLNPGQRGYSLKDLVFYELGYQMTMWKDLITKGKKQIDILEVDIDKIVRYACEDADYTFKLWRIYEHRLREKNLYNLFLNIEIPLITVLVHMELSGILLDVSKLENLSKEIAEKISKIEKQIFEIAGEEFNIKSTVQLREILFEKLGIPTGYLKSTKTGLSTAARELDKLRNYHPIINLILDYRELTKLKNTYIDTLPKQINPKTGRIHSKFNQTITATGRLSSTDPNLQNIPVKNDYGKRIREAFVSESGYRLVSVDYSQIELRIIAFLSQDKVMKKAFKEGKDIHRITASIINNVNLEDVTPQMRRNAKEINFGIIYGMGAYGLAERLHISRTEAKDFIDKYFANYVGIRDYLEKIKQDTRKQGYVSTLTGRRRYLPDINSNIPKLRSAAERMAINFPAQGTSADIIKMSMNNIFGKLKDYIEQNKLRIVLQVHDELVFEIKEEIVSKVLPVIKQQMIKPALDLNIDVPILLDFAIGNSWGNLEELIV